MAISLKSGFGKGIPMAIVLSIVFGLISFALTQFFRAAGFLERCFNMLGIQSWVLVPISYIIVLVCIWLLGIKSSVVIKWFFTKVFKKKEERKFLFCVRIKGFLENYPLGLVSKIYFDENKNKVVYNIVFPNLGGMWTFISVPAENTERDEMSVEEMLLTSFSGGFL
ncbi:MAG: hypothetical protein AAB522_00910 [Patescibacteria group bacterium]